MAQTPISATAVYNSTTPTTIYTVPAGRTAVVKGVLATSVVSNYDQVTVNKVSGGATYPIVINAVTGWDAQSSTYYVEREKKAVNLLDTPITLGAGDSISISTASTAYYKAQMALNNTDYKLTNIRYLNGYYIAVGQNSVTGNGVILTSADGITFTAQTFPYAFTLTDVAYGNGYYVVCNDPGGVVHYSTNLTSWTQVSLPSTYACYTITYGGGKFVTGGASGVSYYATSTPLSWTLATGFGVADIYSIAYIGTNYFYGNAGLSYYTANFSTYTQPYAASVGSLWSMVASNNKLIALRVNALSNNTTVMRTSADGITFSAATIVVNGLSYYGNPSYLTTGAYFIVPYYNQGGGTSYYLASADGVTWTQTTPTSITNYSSAGNITITPFDRTSTDATYSNKVLYWLAESGATYWYYRMATMNTSGVVTSMNWANDVSISSYNYTASSAPVTVGNPHDGTWISVYYYDASGQSGPRLHGVAAAGGISGVGGFSIGSYPGYGFGYVYSVGAIPASSVYLGGTTGGGVLRATSSSASWAMYIGNSAYLTNPPGIIWSRIAGSGCVAVAKSGDTAGSMLLLVWANGVTAVSTNQGSTWTMSSLGMTGINDMTYGRVSASFGNGKFFVANSSGQTAFSTDGITWQTTNSNVQSIYYANSQNIFLGSDSLSVSATGDVTNFTLKTMPTTYSGRSTGRLVYVGSIYYLVLSSSLYASSDLITWTSKTFATTAVNNVSYFSASAYGIAYSGAGSDVVMASAYMNSLSSAAGKVTTAFNPITSLFVGNATASIVEIS